MRWLLALRRAAAALVLITVACSDGPSTPDGGRTAATRIFLTDSPFPFDSIQRVDIYVASVAASTSTDTSAGQPWQTIATPKRRSTCSMSSRALPPSPVLARSPPASTAPFAS
ncbi:MAG: hypothetical protein ACR2OG_12180 [Gemmatimonadaceae bacterium]